MTATIVLTSCSGAEDEDGEAPTQPPPPVSSRFPGSPAWWYGNASTEFEIGRDADIVHQGDTSAYLRAKVANPTSDQFVQMGQSIRADSYRGKRLRWSGYVRTENVGGGGAALWLRGDGPDATIAFDIMEGRRLTGTADWRYVEIVLDIPAEALGVAFGALLAGPGIAWIDDFKLEVVGTEVPVTAPPVHIPNPNPDPDSYVLVFGRLPFTALNLDFEGYVAPVPTQATSDWLRLNSVPFLTDDPGAPEDDLQPLRDIIGNARIIGLGEGTHGTREFFRMKHRIFAWLVRNLGFNHFTIEASLPEALAVDHYVQTGFGDPAYLVRALGFWTWSTEEVYDLVRWMRAWNVAGNQPRVHFTGFDMQFKEVAEDSVRAFAADVSPATGTFVRDAYACLSPFPVTTITIYSRGTQTAKDACRTKLQEVDSLFARNLTSWSASMGAGRTTIIQRLARVVSQWEDMAREPTAPVRDKHMAENLAWWREQLPAGGTAAWAHNGHVMKVRPLMGFYLASRFGSQYLNIATTFSAGQFNAVTQTPALTFTGLALHSLSGSYPGSIESVFDGTGMARAIFDARRISPIGSASSVLARNTTMRSIGSVFASWSSSSRWEGSVALPEDYDVIVWFRNATATRLSLGFVIAPP